jgi:hypothetical protein
MTGAHLDALADTIMAGQMVLQLSSQRVVGSLHPAIIHLPSGCNRDAPGPCERQTHDHCLLIHVAGEGPRNGLPFRILCRGPPEYHQPQAH